MVTHIIVMWWTRVEETETLDNIREWCDCHIGEKESDHDVSHMHGIVMVDRRRGNADTWFETWIFAWSAHLLHFFCQVRCFHRVFRLFLFGGRVAEQPTSISSLIPSPLTTRLGDHPIWFIWLYNTSIYWAVCLYLICESRIWIYEKPGWWLIETVRLYLYIQSSV